MLNYKVNDKFNALPLDKFELKGKMADDYNRFFCGRVLSDYAKTVVYKETEDAFRNQVDDETAVCYWQGEFWGKWVISACRVAKYKKDEELKEFIKNACYNLLSLQREDGYIGTYKNSKNFFAADPTVTKSIIGWNCDWNWNIWSRKYTLWGLMESYALLGDKKILKGAIDHASLLISELEETGAHILDTGTFKGLPSGSIMKPMLILYRYTGDKKYLDFCLSIAERWETPQIAGLIFNSLNMTPIDEWYEESVKWTKTYESLSCFDGILELYRVTGEEKYLKAAENFYDLLEKDEKNILFSVGYNDQYHNAAHEQNSMTEPCDVIHYIRVCYELFALTGEVKYLDSIEMAYYNSLLASFNKDGKWGARAVCSAGVHTMAVAQANLKYNHCCVNNMPRGLLNAAQSALFSDGNQLIIALYHPFNAEIEIGKTKATIEISGDYLRNSAADIKVKFKGNPAPIKLRVPAWSKEGKVTVNGKEYKAESGFFTLPETAEKLEITVQFDNEPHVLGWEKQVVRHNPSDWEYIRLAGPSQYDRIIGRILIDKPKFRIRKGAVLLSRSKLIGNTGEEMFDGGFEISADTKVTLTEKATDADTHLCYTATFDKNGEIYETPVCDYASAGNVETEEKELFSVFF